MSTENTTTAQHTAGPWTSHQNDKGTWVTGRGLTGGELICVLEPYQANMRRSKTEAKATAELIAAAPDLLAALEALLAETVPVDNPEPGTIAALEADARATIAKARGTA